MYFDRRCECHWLRAQTSSTAILQLRRHLKTPEGLIYLTQYPKTSRPEGAAKVAPLVFCMWPKVIHHILVTSVKQS